MAYNKLIIQCIAFLLILVFFSCSDDDDTSTTSDPTATETPTATATPTATSNIRTRNVTEHYLVATADGLYSLGCKSNNNSQEIYGEQQFWLPRNLAVGDQFDSYFFPFEMQHYEVTSDSEEFESAAGSFSEVIMLDSINETNTDWTYVKFKPEYGMLWYRDGYAVGHVDWYCTLDEITIHQNPDPDDAYFALSEGNKWHYSLEESPWPDYGEITIEITGTKMINSQLTYVFKVDKVVYRGW